MKTITLIKTIIVLAVLLVIALGISFIFYPSIPVTDFEKSTVMLKVGNDFNNNNFDGAIKKAETILNGNKKNITALLAVASTLAQKGSIEFKEKEYGQKAIDIANKVLAIEPNNAEAYRIIGYANEIMEKYDDSIVAYNYAIKINPQNPQFHNRIGHAYDLKGDIINAKKHYDKAVKLGGTNESLQMNIGRMLIRSDDEKGAEKIFQNVLDTAVNVRVLAEASYMLGVIALQDNNLDKALFLMKQSTKYDTKFPVGWVGLAQAKILEMTTADSEGDATKLLNEALIYVNRAISLYPNQTVAYVWKARILVIIGNKDNAINAYKNALRIIKQDITLASDEKTTMKTTIVNELEEVKSMKIISAQNTNNNIKEKKGIASVFYTTVFAHGVRKTNDYNYWWNKVNSNRGGHIWSINGSVGVCSNGDTWIYTGSGGGNKTTPPPQKCTQYSAGSWSACTGYDLNTGQGGTQTRSITNSQGGCPSNGRPASSKTCNVPFSFGLGSLIVGAVNKNSVNGNSGSNNGSTGTSTGNTNKNPITMGSSYEIEAVFVGNSKEETSSEAIIAVSSRFANHPDISNLTFSIIDSKPALPSISKYIFRPSVLEPDKYSTGVSFSVKIPRIDPGEYLLRVKVEGGGAVRVANIKLKVRVVDPKFKEI